MTDPLYEITDMNNTYNITIEHYHGPPVSRNTAREIGLAIRSRVRGQSVKPITLKEVTAAQYDTVKPQVDDIVSKINQALRQCLSANGVCKVSLGSQVPFAVKEEVKALFSEEFMIDFHSIYGNTDYCMVKAR